MKTMRLEIDEIEFNLVNRIIPKLEEFDESSEKIPIL